ncbi:MAG: family 78 glycoside hydrolase catalytic domain [Bacteroidales bacterium]|nr:family 78 glycoside hydrolase catalytic domain [Bacteroidales bacterium]
MKHVLFLLLLSVIVSCSRPVENGVKIYDLKTDKKVNPEGINPASPCFMWKINSAKRDIVQTGYVLQIAKSEKSLKNKEELIYDSGIINTDQSNFVYAQNAKFEPNLTYYWRVNVITNQGESGWSKIQKFGTSFPEKYQWNGKWIGEDSLSNQGESINGNTRLAARYLRKTFNAKRGIKKATLNISGLGSYIPFVNGERVGDDVFAPLPTLYTTSIYYNSYDVTSLIKTSQNVLGVVLGNGRFLAMRSNMVSFGLPRMIAELVIVYKDGSKEEIISDETWKITSKGPIIANNEFDGEDYNANLEIKDWNKFKFDDSSWKNVDLMNAPGGELIAQSAPNIKVMDTIKPVSIKKTPKGSYMVDMGQNMVGWLKVNLDGKKDKNVSLKFAETLINDSTLYLANFRSARSEDNYIPSKDGAFTWEPSFVYHGFRFVEISGVENEPKAENLLGVVVYDQMDNSGKITTSNQLMNKLFENSFWGIRGNYRGMPTDCPQRDERLGWLGDRATGAYGEAYVFDNELMYKKWLKDIEDSQSPDGCISDVSPRYWTLYSGNVTWPSAYFYVADMLNKQYGDKEGIIKHYDSMKKWVNYTKDNFMNDNIIVKDTYGDWCMPPESQELIHSQDPARKTPAEVLSTTVYYDILRKMADFAHISGNDDDIVYYMDLANQVKEAYNKKFFNKEKGCYGNNTVTGNILSLRLGLVPEGEEGKVFDNIINVTENDFAGHVSTGVLGIQHLMRGLTENGRGDLAYKLVNNETYPSWGYMINNGATTIWELWNGNTADPAMNSGNHVMLLGDLIIWYFEKIVGIANSPESVGFKQILMNPYFPEGLASAKGSYESLYGTIVSDWKIDDNKLNWNISIPGNSSAVVMIPSRFNVDVDAIPNVKSSDKEDGYTKVVLGSGDYNIVSL